MLFKKIKTPKINNIDNKKTREIFQQFIIFSTSKAYVLTEITNETYRRALHFVIPRILSNGMCFFLTVQYRRFLTANKNPLTHLHTKYYSFFFLMCFTNLGWEIFITTPSRVLLLLK